MLKPYEVPKELNYVGVFLTLRCNFKCTYCINHHGTLSRTEELCWEGWRDGLERIITRPDLPVTLQGGEPTLYPGWMRLAVVLRGKGIPVDVLTNGTFDVGEFMRQVPPDVFHRDAKYASIRFSYHPGTHDAHALATKALLLFNEGYSVGIWGLEHPLHATDNEEMRKICRTYGLDFRLKEFLGVHNGIHYGTVKYKESVDGARHKPVECRTTEMLIGPSGHIFRCHADLYAAYNPIGHITDPDLSKSKIGQWRKCYEYGHCNLCDVKIKTNRLQEYGHTSVEIKK